MSSFLELLRAPSGPINLSDPPHPPHATPGFEGAKGDGEAMLAALGEELADLQERLWAARTEGSRRRILLVLQGMDTSGKGGVLRHTVGLVDPQGVRITAFKEPTPEERAHPFLWRIERALPEAGSIGVFDRSHYEDVLIQRVRGLAPLEEIEERYPAINAFEARLVQGGAALIKCLLQISPEAQKARLRRRLERPDNHWKYSPTHLDDRALWTDYQRAYELAIERTHTALAPWYIIPSDQKWYRNLAVGKLLLETLRGMNLTWPKAHFDVDAEMRRLDTEDPVR